MKIKDTIKDYEEVCALKHEGHPPTSVERFFLKHLRSRSRTPAPIIHRFGVIAE